MYKVRCGIKLDEWENGQVFGSKEDFKTVDKAKIEVDRILTTIVHDMFPEETHDEIFMVSDAKCPDCDCCGGTAYYEDGTELIGRMDGKVDSGEFYIEIVR